jgi:hypothetical protein
MLMKKLKTELRVVEEGIEHMELSDTAWSREYTKLRKQRRILKSTIKRLEKLEVRENG